MWALRREDQCDRAWTATFGSLEDLKKKYPKRETNETAKKLEALTRGTVFDLTPVVGSVEPEQMSRWTEWKRSQGTVDFLSAQIAKPEASIDAPSEEVSRFLEGKRVNLDAIESLLIAGPPPEWAFDLSVPENGRRKPNGLGGRFPESKRHSIQAHPGGTRHHPEAAGCRLCSAVNWRPPTRRIQNLFLSAFPRTDALAFSLVESLRCGSRSRCQGAWTRRSRPSSSGAKARTWWGCRCTSGTTTATGPGRARAAAARSTTFPWRAARPRRCLLYTSDAADE